MRSSPPQPRRLVARERLFKLIDAACSGRALWVAAEAGAGKTSLMASYLADRKLPAIWYRVSAADNDLPTFFHYFGEAVRRARPRMSRPLPHLTPEYLPSVPAFARRYFAQALGGLKGPCIIVLDELQGPALDSPLADILVSAIDDLPERVLVAVLSRNAAPPPFARFLADSTLSSIGTGQMRFGVDEAQMLAGTLGCKDERVVAESVATTRGWAAGLVLLLQSHATDVQATLPQQVLFDYFAAELLERTEPETRVFLLKTAQLPTMTTGDAAAVSGNPRAAQLLARLARQNAFVYQDQAAISFEYHPLFREFLLARGLSELSEDDLARAKDEAARVLEAGGRHEAAADIYLKNRDWARLSALVTGVAPLLLSQGRWRPVNEWISAMPAEHVGRSVELLYWKGTSQIPPAPASARISLSCAYDLALAANDRERALLACCGVLEAYGAELNDFQGAEEWVDRLDALLPDLPDEIPPEIEMRLALAFEAVKWSRPQHALMKRWIERARKRALGPVPPALSLVYACATVYYDLWVGEYQRCAALIQIGRRAAILPDMPPLMRVMWCAVELCYQCFVGDFGAARETGRRIDETSEEFGLYAVTGMLNQCRAYIGLSSGDTKEAYAAIESAVEQLDSARLTQACHCYYIRSQVALARGELDRALNYARTALGMIASLSAPFPVAVNKLAIVQVLIERGEYGEAQVLNEDARRFANELESAHLAWEADLNDAYSHLRQGDQRSAEVFLRRALSLARGKGAVVWDISMPTRIAARLAEAALEAGIEVDYVRDVIRRRALLPQSEYVEGWPWPVRIHSLGRFEIDGEQVELGPRRKASHQPHALLKTILALGGRGVDANMAAKQLRAGGSSDNAGNALKTTLHRLRRHLGREDAILMQDNKLSLNPKVCWWDADAFERLVARSVAAADGERPSEFERIAEQALGLYDGPFLLSDPKSPRVAARRARLQQQLYRLVSQLGGHHEGRGRWDAAERIYRRALEMEPLAEAFYRKLILCLNRQGRHAEAAEAYYRCRDLLEAELGTGPSAETRALVDSIESNHR